MQKKILFISLIQLIFGCCYSQINLKDSTAQSITYWHLGEKYTYDISLQKLKYADADTTSNETMPYEVEVSVLDSTKEYYIIRWFYKNFKSNAQNVFAQKLSKLTQDIGINVKITDLGEIIEITNWEEVQAYITNSIDVLTKEFENSPELEKIFTTLKVLSVPNQQ